MVVFYLVNSMGYFAWMDDKKASTLHILNQKVSTAVVDSYQLLF